MLRRMGSELPLKPGQTCGRKNARRDCRAFLLAFEYCGCLELLFFAVFLVAFLTVFFAAFFAGAFFAAAFLAGAFFAAFLTANFYLFLWFYQRASPQTFSPAFPPLAPAVFLADFFVAFLQELFWLPSWPDFFNCLFRCLRGREPFSPRAFLAGLFSRRFLLWGRFARIWLGNEDALFDNYLVVVGGGEHA